MSERDAFDLRQAETYAQYLRDKMGEREFRRPYQDYNHVPICKGSQWRVFDGIKIPVVNPQEGQETYKRLAFNPFTGEHAILGERELEAYRSQHGA